MLGCKFFSSYHSVNLILELIDTCWDVNKDVQGRRLDLLLRINRYMLGCKFETCANNSCYVCELIDTCWDVNIPKSRAKTSTLLN